MASLTMSRVNVAPSSKAIAGTQLRTKAVAPRAKVNTTVVCGNPNTTGPFAPAVVAARFVLGKKRFNQVRGKGIALHSQVIGEFCKTVGADPKQKQGLIRLAKKNGEKLGFLA